MLFYKITADADQQPRRDGSILVADELYTPKEVEQFKIKPQFYEVVEVPKDKVYYMFGARFAE